MPPEQILPLLTVMVGFGLTLILLTTELLIQPRELEPTIVYTVLVNGVTKLAPAEIEKEFAPTGIIENEFPEQIVPLLTDIVGVGLTVTLQTAVLELTQPCELVPITV